MEEKIYRFSKYFFLITGLAIGLKSFLASDIAHGIMGMATPIFLLVPYILSKVKVKTSYYLYTFYFAFCFVAYNIGCSAAGYRKIFWLDTFSHFISGILFFIIGVCAYHFISKEPLSNKNIFLSLCFGLFFSCFVAVSWEIIEFIDFNLTGHDGQHHLDTGVFDTMIDLISCMIGSIISIISVIIYSKFKVKLLTPKIIFDFIEKNS